jgi:hypothetical protein
VLQAVDRPYRRAREADRAPAGGQRDLTGLVSLLQLLADAPLEGGKLQIAIHAAA